MSKHSNLFRGSSNNGVGTILTEEAVKALETRSELASQTGSFKGTEALFEVAMRGCFTFVKAGPEYDDYYRGFVTGTWDDLDAWIGDRIGGSAGVSNFVPFSNGDLLEERQYIRTAAEVITAFGLVAPAV